MVRCFFNLKKGIRNLKHKKYINELKYIYFCNVSIEFPRLRAFLVKNVNIRGFRHSHVFHSDVLKNLAVVNVPDRLVIPDLGRQEDGSQHDTFPVGRANVDLSIGEEPLQVHLDKRHISFGTPKAWNSYGIFWDSMTVFN